MSLFTRQHFPLEYVTCIAIPWGCVFIVFCWYPLFCIYLLRVGLFPWHGLAVSGAPLVANVAKQKLLRLSIHKCTTFRVKHRRMAQRADRCGSYSLIYISIASSVQSFDVQSYSGTCIGIYVVCIWSYTGRLQIVKYFNKGRPHLAAHRSRKICAKLRLYFDVVPPKQSWCLVFRLSF